MPLKIRISNQNRRRRISLKAVKKTVMLLLKSRGTREALIDITFVGNRRIKVLNKKYMGRSGPTDVISFLLEEKSIPRKKTLIGDIYISSDMAYSNARRFNTSTRKELLRYAIHGLLHLLGFGDKTAKEKKQIRKLEEKFLKK